MDKYGFVDKSGNEVIPLKYDGTRGVSKGLAPVGLNNKIVCLRAALKGLNFIA